MSAWKMIRLTLGTLLVALALRQLWHAWADAQRAPVQWHLKPLLLVASALLTWTMYAVLIMAWRAMSSSVSG